MGTTYDPKSKTTYFIEQWDLENWLQEQYDIPRFNVPSDLEESASPDGSYTVNVDGEISDYKQDGVNKFFEDAKEQKKKSDDIPYVAPDTRHMTGPLLNKLAQDGHIPKGKYVIELTF